MTNTTPASSESLLPSNESSNEGSHKGKLRSFLALDLPPAVLAALRQRVAELKSVPALKKLRWIPAGNWHLTLVFLGDQTEDGLQQLWQGVESTVAEYSPVPADLTMVAGFPDAKSPILAALVDPVQGLLALQSAVRRCCNRQGIPADRRRFKPHITLARAHKRRPVHYHGEPLVMPVVWSSLTLYTSELTQVGSIYRAYRSLALGHRASD